MWTLPCGQRGYRLGLPSHLRPKLSSRAGEARPGTSQLHSTVSIGQTVLLPLERSLAVLRRLGMTGHEARQKSPRFKKRRAARSLLRLRDERPTAACSVMGIPIQNLHIGMQVRHPRYGVGTIKALTEHTADLTFEDAPRTVDPTTSDLSAAEPTASLTEMQLPLSVLIRQTAQAMVDALGLEKPDQLVEGLATKWQRGTLALQPPDDRCRQKKCRSKRSSTRSS